MAIELTRGLSPVRSTLANGAVVLVQQTSMAPAVTIDCAFDAGSIYDPAARPGVAHLAGRVLDRGSLTRSADQLAEELDERGVALRVTTTRHRLAVSCTCLAEDFDAVLAILLVTFPFFALVLCGYVAARRGWLPQPAIPGLNTFVLYFALPCMLYRFGSTTPIGQFANASVVGVYLVCAATMVAFTVAVTMSRRIDWNDAAFGALVGAFPSASIISIGEVIGKVRTLLDQMALAILMSASVTILAGIAVLVASGLYIWRREVTLGLRR